MGDLGSIPAPKSASTWPTDEVGMLSDPLLLMAVSLVKISCEAVLMSLCLDLGYFCCSYLSGSRNIDLWHVVLPVRAQQLMKKLGYSAILVSQIHPILDTSIARRYL